MLNNDIVYFDELDSTNAKIRQLADYGAESGLVIRAGFQTTGRGRLGRSWSSFRDQGIYMSILLKTSKKKHLSAPISLVTGLGVRNIVEYYIQTGTTIKWPNDVLSGHLKLAGILVETVTVLEGGYFIIGIGININDRSFPADLASKATSFFMETGKLFDLDQIAARLVKELDLLYTQFFEGYPVLDEYTKHCVNIGSDVRIINNGRETLGVAKSITPQGELIVETYHGELIEARSGEVSVRGLDGYTNIQTNVPPRSAKLHHPL